MTPGSTKMLLLLGGMPRSSWRVTSKKCRRRSIATSDPQSAAGRTIITMAVTVGITLQAKVMEKPHKLGPILARHNISFKVITDAGISGAIIQKMLQHTGHDEGNSKEKNRIHPDLHSLIEIWLQQGCSTSEILIKSYDWAQQNGHVDKKDRRFYLTPNDIRLLKKNLRGVGDSDSVSVDHLVSMELRDNICFYQPLHNEQPFILVVQTPFQKQLLEENPHPMVFMDASYKGITAYGYAFYALLLINKTGRGVPFAYFILSKETTATVSLCLQKLQLSNPSFYPRSVKC